IFRHPQKGPAMPESDHALIDTLCAQPPFDALTDAMRARLAPMLDAIDLAQGETLFEKGTPLRGLYVIISGAFDIQTGANDLVSHRGPGDIMGERGLLRDGTAQLTARASEPARLILIPGSEFLALIEESDDIARWFARARPTDPSDSGPYATGLTALQVSDLMAKHPVTCGPEATITDVAKLMRDNVISSVVVMEGGQLTGIITAHDLTNKVLAEGLDGQIRVAQVMTPDPVTIAPNRLGLDALMLLSELKVNHLPVAQGGRVVGMIGKTDLFRQQAATASHMVADIAHAETPDDMAHVIERVPGLLAQLVQAGVKPASITRRITDITDAITRRLLRLAEARLGPPPVPYLWAACGSQGRREQTGVSDQDNCLILDDAATPADDAYFEALARFVCGGLAEIGFYLCPGEMMATTPRWRQPRRVWRGYFDHWIAEPDKEAQMLASVMFDLRPIAGRAALFEELQCDTLRMARGNSIFVSHMISNALTHTPPLSLFRGFALIRSGEHKNTVDLKMAGVVPVVDLGRVYALWGALEPVNTRERIVAAGEAGV